MSDSSATTLESRSGIVLTRQSNTSLQTISYSDYLDPSQHPERYSVA